MVAVYMLVLLENGNCQSIWSGANLVSVSAVVRINKPKEVQGVLVSLGPE